ncbi:MAG: hypothetical protein QM504_03180 [Pseudomonadota bacterium]
MKKSAILFSSGIACGIILTMAFSFTNTNSISINNEINKVNNAITQLNSTTYKLEKLIQKYTHILPQNIEHNANIQQTETNDTDISLNTTDVTSYTPQLTQSAPTPPISSPTSTQLEQYNTIETQLYEAANNPNIQLSALINNANNLTHEQREILTNRAMEMIKNGELDISQFSTNPDS